MERPETIIENETPTPEILAQKERELNEIIPILAHGLVKRLEQKGLAGKVHVNAMAGNDWGVAKSPDNISDIPNVIVYPREYLGKDKRLVNARLRHEIGNLNYPISTEIGELVNWCKDNNIQPELLTSLAEAVNEASVNYQEMRNSHSDWPEENFRALYEHEINTKNIAEDIGKSDPYKQAVDVSLLHSLSQIGIIPREQFEEAMQNSSQAVRGVFDEETMSLLNQAIRTTNPAQKTQLIKDYLWPKFSKLIEPPQEDEDNAQNSGEQQNQNNDEASPENKMEEGEDQSDLNEDLENQATSERDGSPSEDDAHREGEKEQKGENVQSGADHGPIEHKEDGVDKSAFQDVLSHIEKELDKLESLSRDGDSQETREEIGGQFPEQDKTEETALNRESDLMPHSSAKSNYEDIKARIEQGINSLQESKGQGGQELIDKLIALQQQLEQAESSPEELGGPFSKYDEFVRGGKSHERSVRDLFSQPNPGLLKQLHQLEQGISSKFTSQDEEGNISDKKAEIDDEVFQRLQDERIDKIRKVQLNTLDELKRQQQSKLESVYREMSGLNGEVLRIYVEYMESMRGFIDDLTEFFIQKFKLDREYVYEKHHRRGVRLEKGYTHNILGQNKGRIIIDPASMERKRPPSKPTIVWTLVIDNSISCGGEVIEQEKRLAVALIEVATRLDIPLEVVTFGGEYKNGKKTDYIFLKSFEQESQGEDLQKIVLLQADQGTPDVVTLDAACASMEQFSGKFQRSYNFIYFMTDGQSGSGSIKEVIDKHKTNMVMTGIGLAEAAKSISQTWGKNSLPVPDAKNLSDAFIRKVEQQIDQTFD